MFRFVFLFLAPVSVTAGLLDWFQLLSWSEKELFGHQWTSAGVNYQTTTTLSFISVCDWSRSDVIGAEAMGTMHGGNPTFTSANKLRNRHCGNTCVLLLEAFGDAGYPHASSGYSASDHVNFVCMVPSVEDAHVVMTNEGADADKLANVLLSFRGTFAWDVVNNRRNSDTTFTATSLCTNCAVHSGFWRNFVALKFSISKVVNQATDGSIPKMDFEILEDDRKFGIFGHSMGAALSHLSATYFANGGQDVVGLYTIGSPRLGNKKFAAKIAASARKYALLQNARDPVPHLGRHVGLRHPSSKIYELFMDPTYHVGLKSGDIDKNYAKYLRYNLHDSDASFARNVGVLESSAHMNYYIGLDSDDLMTCGGMSDYYMRNTHATSLFG